MPTNPTPEELAALRDMALRLSDALAVASSDDFEAICSALPRLLDALEAEQRTSISYKDEMDWAHKALDSMRADLATEQAIVKKWNCEMSKVLAGSEYINEPAAYVRAFRAKSDTIKEQAIEIRTERTARESAERELAEARAANQILTESGVRGHEAVCAMAKERDGLVRELAKANAKLDNYRDEVGLSRKTEECSAELITLLTAERDGLAAALDVRRSITALRERPLYADESVTDHAEALAALYKLLEMEPASILAAHDARLTEPLERRVGELEATL